MTDNSLDKRILYVFNKRGGKVVKCIEGTGRGVIGLWAFQNTSKGRVAVLTLDDGLIERVYIGNEGCPNVKYIHKTNYVLDIGSYVIDDQHINLSQLISDLEELKI